MSDGHDLLTAEIEKFNAKIEAVAAMPITIGMTEEYIASKREEIVYLRKRRNELKDAREVLREVEWEAKDAP